MRKAVGTKFEWCKLKFELQMNSSDSLNKSAKQRILFFTVIDFRIMSVGWFIWTGLCGSWMFLPPDEMSYKNTRLRDVKNEPISWRERKNGSFMINRAKPVPKWAKRAWESLSICFLLEKRGYRATLHLHQHIFGISSARRPPARVIYTYLKFIYHI